MKLLTSFVSAVLMLCSGCATVSHFDQPERTGNVPAPTIVDAPPGAETPTNSTAVLALALRPADWHLDERERLWFADLDASSHLTLASDSDAAGNSEILSPPLNPFSKAYVGLVWDDIKATFTAPTDWNGRDWLIGGEHRYGGGFR